MKPRKTRLHAEIKDLPQRGKWRNAWRTFFAEKYRVRKPDSSLWHRHSWRCCRVGNSVSRRS